MCPARRPQPEHLYDLFGIAVHHGTMQNGHYTSFVRRQANWYHCDDAWVQAASVQEVSDLISRVVLSPSPESIQSRCDDDKAARVALHPRCNSPTTPSRINHSNT